MKLYASPASSFARKIRVMLIEKNISHEVEMVNLWEPNELQETNPIGKVPALKLDDGRVLISSPLIADFVDSKYPHPRFIPADADGRIEVRCWEALADGTMDAVGTSLYEMRFHDEAKRSQAWLDRQRSKIDAGLAALEGMLGNEVPAGNWTIMRLGRRNNGAVTRPAPLPGVGFESDKFDTVALNTHLDEYIGKLLRKIGESDTTTPGGLKMLHMDSWEMGSQNWTPRLRQEFIKRRGYDPFPFYPVYAGNIVESRELSERFLWDLRLTSQELVLDYHAGHVKKYSHRHGLGLSIEPYDMNPTADLELGSVADIPMCEFWSKDYGFNTSFSCIEAASIAHVNGISLVPAEAFTAEKNEGWKQYPGSMKAQGDWAFATGINRFVFHTFQHQLPG